MSGPWRDWAEHGPDKPPPPMPTKDEAIDALSTAIGIALLTSQHTPVSIPIDVARIALLHLRAASQPVAEEPCAGCRGRRWVNDENWQPSYPESWKGERYRGDGLIPCGSCNEGGWDVAVGQPVAEERT